MANTDRRKQYTDNNGNMFIPMNVEGGVWNEHFITTPKFVTILAIIATLFLTIIYINARENVTVISYFVYFGTWFIISSLALRFIVFEEKFYYNMYKKLQKHGITTPAIFWDIVYINDTDDGAVVTFSDTRLGVFVKLDRDTIIGKDDEFKEMHYDAISEFYKEIVSLKYNFVQMNIMERAGKDPRLKELSELTYKNDNPNICKLMELQIGHIKTVTNESLYETDYFLFYTNDLSKSNTIIQEISDSLFKILDGAYIGYQILTFNNILELVKELRGVNYFNPTEASIMLFDLENSIAMKPFNISNIIWKDGNNQKLNSVEVAKINNIASEILKGDIESSKISFKKAVYRKEKESEFGVDFNDLFGIDNDTNKNSQINNLGNEELLNNDENTFIDF